MIRIKDIPLNLRPREKAYIQGVKSLSDAELLAILISSGTKKMSALDLAYTLLRRFGSIEGLSLISVDELIKVDGIKKSKAIKIVASFELIRRFEKSIISPKMKVDSVEKAMKLLIPKCFAQSRESLFLILLNEEYGFIRMMQLYIGTEIEISLSPKEILQEIVKSTASKVYIGHNHPSNHIKPSKADQESTRMITLFLESFSIEVIDSLIIGNKKTYSMMLDSEFENQLIVK